VRKVKLVLGATIVAFGLAVPAASALPDEDRKKPAPSDEDDDVLDDIQKKLRSLPERLEKALEELRRDAPERAKEVERHAREALDDILESIGQKRRKDTVHVRVGSHEMDVPATVKHGKAKLY
jgi:hypothetical protein